MDIATKATKLLELHHTGTTLVLPNVWDAWSARAVAEAGFGALSIGSHPLADSRGQGDNEDMSIDDALDGVRRICSAVPDVPVTADMEAGYGAAPAELIERLLEAGAVGLNVEDTVHSEGGRLRSVAEHADYIGGLRQAADAAGVHVVINARTDLFVKEIGDEADRVDRAIARLKLAAEAGADVLYPVGFHSDDVQKRLTSELPLPVNAIGHPANSDKSALAGLGVARVSFGPIWQAVLAERSNEVLARWT